MGIPHRLARATWLLLSAAALAALPLQVGAKTIIVSRVKWSHGLKISITLPRGWTVLSRDPAWRWTQNAYGIEVRSSPSDGPRAAEPPPTLAFVRSWRGRQQRGGVLPGLWTDVELAKRGFRYIRHFSIKSGQRGVVATYDSSMDRTVAAQYRTKCAWYFTIDLGSRHDHATIGVHLTARRPVTPNLSAAMIQTLRSIRFQRDLSGVLKAARREHEVVVKVP